MNTSPILLVGVRWYFVRLALLTALTALASCAGSGEGLDANGRPVSEFNGTLTESEFDTIQTTIFTPICTECHQGANAPLGLRLEAGASYDLLVGVPSAQASSLLRVQPGNPSASYLVQKISGTAAEGGRMPLDRPPLTQAQIDLIRQWIANGALAPSVATASQSIEVHLTAPMDGSIVTERVERIVVAFDRELDANLVNDTTVMLERFDSEARSPIRARLRVLPARPYTLLIAPFAPLTPGHYSVILRGTGGGALAGLHGGPLGSSDGNGADFVVRFEVTSQ